jgi:hypothetical protein
MIIRNKNKICYLTVSVLIINQHWVAIEMIISCQWIRIAFFCSLLKAFHRGLQKQNMLFEYKTPMTCKKLWTRYFKYKLTNKVDLMKGTWTFNERKVALQPAMLNPIKLPVHVMSSTKISLMSCPHRYPLYNLSTLHMCHYCEIKIRLAAVLSKR